MSDGLHLIQFAGEPGLQDGPLFLMGCNIGTHAAGVKWGRDHSYALTFAGVDEAKAFWAVFDRHYTGESILVDVVRKPATEV